MLSRASDAAAPGGLVFNPTHVSSLSAYRPEHSSAHEKQVTPEKMIGRRRALHFAPVSHIEADAA